MKYYVRGTPEKSEEIIKLLGGKLENPDEDLGVFEDPDYYFYVNQEGYIKGVKDRGLFIEEEWKEIFMMT